MTFRLLALVVCLLLAPVLSAQTPWMLGWDYPIAELPALTEFQLKVDGGAYMSLGLPTPEVLADTPAYHKSFRAPFPLAPGPGEHQLAVRACAGALGCSWDASLVFRFVGPPLNVRIVKR